MPSRRTVCLPWGLRRWKVRNNGGNDGWGLIEKLDPPDNENNDEFGYSVAIKSGTIAVGSRLDDDIALNAGAVYIYEVRINNAPGDSTPLPDQFAVVDEPFDLSLPETLFGDPDVDETLVWSVTADGTPLPDGWLQFDPVNRTIHGTPTAADLGVRVMVVTVTDYDGASASSSFDLDPASWRGELREHWKRNKEEWSDSLK